MSAKENRHAKQEDRDEIKQYKQRKSLYEDEELLDEDELDPDILDFIHRHIK